MTIAEAWGPRRGAGGPRSLTDLLQLLFYPYIIGLGGVNVKGSNGVFPGRGLGLGFQVLFLPSITIYYNPFLFITVPFSRSR
jgi:hypothetical protein